MENLNFRAVIAFGEMYCVLTKVKNNVQMFHVKNGKLKITTPFPLSSFEFLML